MAAELIPVDELTLLTERILVFAATVAAKSIWQSSIFQQLSLLFVVGEATPVGPLRRSRSWVACRNVSFVHSYCMGTWLLQ